MKKIILLTDKNNFFGQTRKPWVSMDTKKMVQFIEKRGFSVTVYSYETIVNQDIMLHDSIIFYTFHQKPNRRTYLKDVIRYLDNGTNVFIPDTQFLYCHENKGYQELYKKKIGYANLKAYYFSNYDDTQKYDLPFPIVLKTVDGSNSTGVFLVQNRKELRKIIKSMQKTSLFLTLDLLRRKYLRKKKFKEYPDHNDKKDYEHYREYIIPEKNFILQEFIPNLKYDYRVLILYDKYFVTKRYTKKNDFRASGAKKFEFNFEPEPSLLNFAKEVYQKFSSPFFSIDVVHDGKKYYLVEYQALHFGINVFVKNSRYYMFSSGNWDEHKITDSFEYYLANALCDYLERLD